MSTVIDWITNLALQMCFGVKELAVMLVSWVPMIELKGAIPIGTKLGLGLPQSFWLAWIGSSLLCIPLMLIFKPLFKWAKTNKKIGGFFNRVENVFRQKASKLLNKSDSLEQSGTDNKKITFFKALGVFIFVAIPAPITGVWTGSLVAVLLNLKFFWAAISIALGNLVAGALIMLLTALLGKYIDWFLLVLFAAVIVLFIIFLIKVFKKRPAEQQNAETPASDSHIS